MAPVKVVVRYQDGKILKGNTLDFFPNRDIFHLQLQNQGSGEAVTVLVKDLKAVFFVRDFGGNAAHQDRLHFIEGQAVQGRKIEVLFKDGERLVGTTMGYEPTRAGFFVIPADNQTNNERVYVVQAAVDTVRFL